MTVTDVSLSETGKDPTAGAPDEPAAGDFWSDPRRVLGAFGGVWLMLVIILVVYAPALFGGFILDDRPYVIDNPLVTSQDGLIRIWLLAEGDDYWPVTYSAFWLQRLVWGAQPLGYHVVTLAVHALNCWLLWQLLGRLAIPGGFLAALLFAVHPLNVEAAAWIFQLKTTLALALLLFAILRFVDAEDSGFDDGRLYVQSQIAFALSLLAKTSTIAMAPIFLATIWWRRGRIRRADLVEVFPFALISLVAGCIALSQRWTGVPLDPARDDSLFSRTAVAGRAVVFYLSKALWPADLCFVYPRWTLPAGSQGSDWIPLVALAGTGLVLWRNRSGWGRPWVAGAIWYLLALLPVVGFATIPYMRYSLVADHWHYVAMVAIVSGIAAVVMTMPRAVSAIVAPLLVAILAVVSWREARQYADAERLYRSTLARNPACWFIENALGSELADRGKHAEAAEHFETAIKLKPDYGDAMSNLATTLTHLGRREQASTLLDEAIRLDPSLPEPHFNRAVMLAEDRRFEEAIEHYEQAVRLNPQYVAALNNLGTTCLEVGRFDESVAHLRAADRLLPDRFQTHFNLSLALAAGGDRAAAEVEFAKAVALNPQLSSTRPLWEKKVQDLSRLQKP